MTKKRWTWADHPIYGRGRGVIKDEGRSLSYGNTVIITSAAANDVIDGGEAFSLIPKMCDVLNAHWSDKADDTQSEEQK